MPMPGFLFDMKKRVKIISWVLILLFVLPLAAASQEKLYFTGLVEKNDMGSHQVLLEWGPLEGGIPDDIVRFRIYRSENGGPYTLLATQPVVYGTPASAADLNNLIHQNRRIERRFKELTQVLNDLDSSITPANFHVFLYNILNQGSAQYDPMKRMFLIRRFPEVAVATGLGYVDTTVFGAKKYTYLLTAVKQDKTETSPIGQTGEITPSQPTTLPAVEGFRQVFVSGCSELRKSLDDNLIHFSWNTHDNPNELGFKVLIYGYDIYWSDTDLGEINPLDSEQLQKLTRLNSVPIIAAGAPAAQGPDSFLAKDDGATHVNGPAWKRGQPYYYYIFSRDIGGHYCSETSPVKAVVVDRTPPVTPFNLHTEEMKGSLSLVAKTTPRLALVWDQINGRNYARYYGGVKEITGYDDTSVTYTYQKSAAISRVKDMDVSHYRVFRFETPEAASRWGLDMDGDLWPDLQEREAGTDPCDKASHPGGNPAEYLISIVQNDALFQRKLNNDNDHIQMIYTDKTILPDNNVYWYRILAVDKSGNQSPLSAPIRGVLFDRTQPSADSISIQTRSCTYGATHSFNCNEQENCAGEDQSGAFLTLVDKNSKAAYYEFIRYCSDGTDNQTYTSMARGKTTGIFTCVDYKAISPRALACHDIAPVQCGDDQIKEQGYIVRFYDGNKNLITQSAPFGIESFCSGGGGCVELVGNCTFRDRYSPGLVITEWPIKVCVNLSKGEMARIYHRTDKGMSPVATMETAQADGTFCHELNDLDTIVPSDLCLGVRIFSQNHVGSSMHYLPCVQTNAGGDPPATPIIEDVKPENRWGQRSFMITWGCQSDGLSAFLISMASGGEQRYITDWAMEKNDQGKFMYLLKLDDPDLDKKWCFQIQALDSALQKSEWSLERCNIWELETPENLAWPRVEKPGTGGSLSAFVLLGGDPESVYYNLPLIVVSDALNPNDRDFNLNDALVCNGNNEMGCLLDGPVAVTSYGHSQCLSNYLQRSLMFDSFIVYVQEQGKDYVQAGPLIQKVHSTSVRIEKSCNTTMHDPYIFLRNFNSASIGGGDEVSLEDCQGTRLVYLDRYPHPGGARIRYKVVAVDSISGEPETIYTTNWVDLP